jgi:hypothetical protein
LAEAIIYSMAIDKVAALRATVLFGGLTNEELRALASLCTEHKLSREEVLFIAGEEARGLYVVEERWETGESIVVNENGSQRSHGIVLLRISNRGKEAAHKVVLSIREKDFSAQGEYAEDLWELETNGWREVTIKFSRLAAKPKCYFAPCTYAGHK